MERAFDRACAATGDPEAVLRLPRLEVTVRVDGVAALDSTLPALVEAALSARLAELTAAAAPAPAAGGATADTRTAMTSAREPWRTPAEEGVLALLHYLRTGSLPWGTLASESSTVARRVLRAACADAADQVADTLLAIGAPEPACFRLLALLDAASASAIAARLAARWRTESGVSARAAVADAAAALDSVLGEPAAAGGHARLASAARQLADACRGRPTGSPDPRGRDTAGSPAAHAAATPANRSPGNDEPLALAVDCAGLVLVHPFLPAFLHAVGVDPAVPADRPRAAAVLHHLATGRREVDEWELPLVKALVGMSPEDALPVSDGLVTDDDVREADALLTAAIGHWGALGGTSPAGLRTAFLARRGLLDRPGGTWRLRVEPAAHDLLLGTLPWAISLVVLPWLSAPLHVEWSAP